MRGFGFFVSFVLPLMCCLKVNVQIPEIVDIRESATLICSYDLGGDKLYSIKWYKEDSEFYRFMPQNNPPFQTFPVDGVHVDERESNATVIILNPLKYESSGYYKCEISLERPHFKTDFKGSNMNVLGLPRENPKIEGVKTVYSIGDIVAANCTSSPSNPPADIEWFINSEKAHDWFLERYNPTLRDIYNLQSRTLGLKFRIDEAHYQDGNILALTCQVTVAGRRRSKTIYSTQPKFMTNQKYAKQFSNNGGLTLRIQKITALSILLLKVL